MTDKMTEAEKTAFRKGYWGGFWTGGTITALILMAVTFVLFAIFRS